MARILNADEARGSIEWLQIKQADDGHPWWVMELLECHKRQEDGSVSPRVFGACVAKCLTYELARSIVLQHTTGQLVHTQKHIPWPMPMFP